MRRVVKWAYLALQFIGSVFDVRDLVGFVRRSLQASGPVMLGVGAALWVFDNVPTLPLILLSIGAFILFLIILPDLWTWLPRRAEAYPEDNHQAVAGPEEAGPRRDREIALADDLGVAFRASGVQAYAEARAILVKLVESMTLGSAGFYRIEEEAWINTGLYGGRPENPTLVQNILEDVSEHTVANIGQAISWDYSEAFAALKDDANAEEVIDSFMRFYQQYLTIIGWMARQGGMADGLSRIGRSEHEQWAQNDQDLANRIREIGVKYPRKGLGALIGRGHWIHKWARSLPAYALQ